MLGPVIHTGMLVASQVTKPLFDRASRWADASIGTNKEMVHSLPVSGMPVLD